MLYAAADSQLRRHWITCARVRLWHAWPETVFIFICVGQDYFIKQHGDASPNTLPPSTRILPYCSQKVLKVLIVHVSFHPENDSTIYLATEPNTCQNLTIWRYFPAKTTKLKMRNCSLCTEEDICCAFCFTPYTLHTWGISCFRNNYSMSFIHPL